MRWILTYFKNEVASICERETVEAVIDGFTVVMAVLARVFLINIILQSKLSHVSSVIVMMITYDGLVTSAYIIQTVSSLQAHAYRSFLLRSLSRMLYVTLLNLKYVR